MSNPVEIRSLTEKEIPQAMAIHHQWWGQNDEILSEKDLHRLVEKNANYQLGLFIRGRLIATVCTASVRTGRVSEGQEMLPSDEMPQHYRQTKGIARRDANTHSCFVVSRDKHMTEDEKAAFANHARQLFPPETKFPAKFNPAHALILTVKQKAEKDPTVLYLTAMSTAENLEGRNATLEQIQRAIPTARNMTVLHGQAQVWKIKPQGRPDAPFGANSLVVMHYPLGKWQTVVKEVLEGLQGKPLRVEENPTRRLLKRHGIAVPSTSKRRAGIEVRLRDKQLHLAAENSRQVQELIPQIQAVLDRANGLHATKAKLITTDSGNRLRIKFSH